MIRKNCCGVWRGGSDADRVGAIAAAGLARSCSELEGTGAAVKLWSCSGEALSGELARRFRQGFPQATLLNIYGRRKWRRM